MLDPQEVLNKAADIIETKGWIQGKNIGPNGEICLSQAINEVVLDDLQLYLDVMNLVNSFHICTITWQDQLGRTKEEVVSFLRRCANK